MRRVLEERLAAVVGRQLGVVTLRQLREVGVGEWLVRARLAAGAWTRLSRTVVRVAPGPASPLQLDLVAQLTAGEGAVLSHHTAAGHLSLDVPRGGPRHVMVPAARCVAPISDVRVYRSRDLLPEDVTARGPFRFTRLGRTVVDLAAVLDDGWLRAVVDSALRQRPSNRKWLELALEQHGAGRRGAERLRRLLDAQAREDGLTDSALESLAMELGLATGRKPHLHHRIADGCSFWGELDFAWPELRLCVELDGYGGHATRGAFQRDRERDRALFALGWAVLRFTWTDVDSNRQRFVEELSRAHRLRQVAVARDRVG